MEDDSSLVFANFDFDVHQKSQYLERMPSSSFRALITKPSNPSVKFLWTDCVVKVKIGELCT